MGSGIEPTVSVEFEVYGKVQGIFFHKQWINREC